MKTTSIIFFSVFLLSVASGQQDNNANHSRIISTIDSTYNNEIVLIQEFTVNVPIDSVWSAFTTKEGWEAAFVPLAKIDFRINGTIKTSYDKNATIGDSTTIVNHIINYVPKKILTLQPEIADNFPEFMKQESKSFYNVIYFKEIAGGKTKIESYGIGYKNNQKYLSLLKFFISGNEMSYLNLIKYLETGKGVKH